MTDLEKTILRELSALPQSRQTEVLAFVRYLRLSLMDDDEMERRFDTAVIKARTRAQLYDITDKDIEEEIRAVREERARSS
jgi:hypothetical protein